MERKGQEERRVLVTGGAGFIGSNYLNYAVRKYPRYCFTNVDALTYAGRLANIEVSKAKNYSFVKADIRDLAGMERIFRKHKPTHIIHFAAESHVDVSIKNPDIFIETNVVGTHNLLVLAKRHCVRRFHHISTDEVYGSLKKNTRPSKEGDTLAPSSPYSASKAGADMLVLAYNRTFGLDVVTTRLSNNYGPRQNEEKLIPLSITNLLAGKNVPLYGSGKHVRSWLYVEDGVKGIDLAFHKGKSGEIYNIGGHDELPNFKVAQMLVRALGKNNRRHIEYVEDRLGHDFRYALECSKARKTLGWRPKISFASGLEKTIQYYRSKTFRTRTNSRR